MQDWSGSPSVYGPLATAIQALASLAGGTSARFTVIVLGLANLAAFAGTALLLHWMTRDRPAWQLRAALLWAANPLLLQVLVAVRASGWPGHRVRRGGRSLSSRGDVLRSPRDPGG